MAKISSNMGLTLPEQFDRVDIDALSGNFVIIDTKFAETVTKETIANDLATTEGGKVLDARQGKELSDRVAKYEQTVKLIEDGIDLNGKYIDNALFR